MEKISSDQIYVISDKEIDSLYIRYEARLGAMITKTLGRAALQLGALALGIVLPIPPKKSS